MKQLFCKTFTPIFATPEYAQHFSTNPAQFADNQGLYRPLECVLFAGAEVIHRGGGEIETPSYAPGVFYTDERLLTDEVQVHQEFPTERTVLEKIRSCLGLPYVWGGNDPNGFETFAALFGYTGSFFKGVDCSGLLYYGFNGHIPRNTSQLFTFGEEISPDEVKPLDICVWKGHVVIFLSEDVIIESIEKKGVVLSAAKQRLSLERGIVFRRVFQPAKELFLKSVNMVV